MHQITFVGRTENYQTFEVTAYVRDNGVPAQVTVYARTLDLDDDPLVARFKATSRWTPTGNALLSEAVNPQAVYDYCRQEFNVGSEDEEVLALLETR